MIPPITPPIWPPGTPPGTPPTTPPIEATGGGASSSLIILISLGIDVGVRSCPLTRSVWTCFTTRTGAAAGGGGGGGGGGGATSIAVNSRVGRASVNSSGRITITAMRMTCRPKENMVVIPRLVFSLPPDSRRLSSNMGNLRKTGPYVGLRHRVLAICSQNSGKIEPGPKTPKTYIRPTLNGQGGGCHFLAAGPEKSSRRVDRREPLPGT